MRYTSSVKKLYALVDDHIQEYENGNIAVSDDIPFFDALHRQTITRAYPASPTTTAR